MADEKVRDEMPERVITLAEQQAFGDFSPDDVSIRETRSVVEIARARDADDFPLSCRKVLELIDSVLALRAELRRCVRADLLARVEAERDAEKQRAERWKALATSAECAGCGQPNKGEADWWAGCGDDWHERQREALAAESDATERKT